MKVGKLKSNHNRALKFEIYMPIYSGFPNPNYIYIYKSDFAW